MDFEPMSIRREPVPDALVFVVRGVVLNQHCATPTVTAAELFQESSISGRVEDAVLSVVEASAPQVDCAKDLHVFAFSRNRDLGRATDSTPGRM